MPLHYPPTTDPVFNQVARREADALRFHQTDPETCQLCGATGADKRNLFLDCGYDLAESVPEAINIGNVGLESHTRGWYLCLCKSCRGHLLHHLEQWRAECIGRRDLKKDHDGYPDMD